MKRLNTYLLVAAMAVSGMSYATAADINTNVGNNTAKTDMQAGQPADASTQREIRSTLANVVNDAVSPNHFSNLHGYLAKADKDRLIDMKKATVDDLNSAINQFRADFKNKYNQDFDIQGDHFKDAMITAGQDKKSATASLVNADLANAGGNSLNSTNTTITQTNTPSNNSTPPQPGMTNGAPADRVLDTPPGMVTSSNRNGQQSGAADDGSTSGKATGPASSGSNANSTVHGNDTNANPGLKPADANMATNTTVINSNSIASAGDVTLNLVNEGHVMNAWRIDVPEQISTEQLKQNLVKHIQMLDDQKATWPSDVNAAYRSVAYHVLKSFGDSSLASER